MAIQLNHRQNSITTGANAETAGVTLVINNTGSLTLPKGTTAQRPGSAVAGDFRYNTSNNVLEYFNGSVWISVVAGYVEDLRGSDGTVIVDGVNNSGAVNYVQISNALTGNDVSVAATGSDSNVGMDLLTKGTGNFTFADGTGTILTVTDGGAANVTIRGHATTARIESNNDLAVTGDKIELLATSSVTVQAGSGNFIVTDGTNTGLTVDVSGANGISLKAGGSEAEISTQGDLFINSTGGDLRLGNGTTDGLVINTNTPGATVTLQTTATGATIFVSADQTLKFNASDFDFSNKVLKNVATPTQPTDAANKQYVDAAIAGLDWKQSVKAATTVNIALSGEQTVDGVSLVSGDRILVKNQSTASENGIYIVKSGSWTRASDADEDSEVTAGLAVFVEQGTTNADTGWVLVTDDPITVGTTNLTFTQFTGAASLNIVGDDGIIVTLTGNTYTIEADTDEVTITRGSGGNGKLAVFAPSGTPAGSVLRAPASTPGTATWGALDLANSNAVTGTLPEANGGTGENTYSQGDILVGDASNGLTKLTLGANKTFLKSNGTTLVYASAQINDIDGFNVTGPLTYQVLTYNGTNWVNGSVNLSTSAVTGTLPVGNGGTGLNTVVSGGLLFGDGGSALQVLPIGTASSANTAYVLKTNSTGTAPEWGTIALNQLSDVSAPTPAANQLLVFNGSEWVNQNVSTLDKLVRVSNADTTSGFLSDKLVAATNGAVTFTIANAGADEDYTLAVNVDSATIRVNGSNQLAVGEGTANQVLISQGAGNDATWSYLSVLRNTAGNVILEVSGNVGSPVKISAGASLTEVNFGSPNVNIVTSGGNVFLNGVKFPNTIPAESVLVTQSSANELVTVKAGGNDDKLLLWSGTTSAFTFVSAGVVGGNKFTTVAFGGNVTPGTSSIEADSNTDTLTISAGVGITITVASATDSFEVRFSNAGMADTAVTLADTVAFFDNSNSNKPEFRSFQNIFSDLDVPFSITANGFVVRTADNTFTSRSIATATSADKLGIFLVNGDGVAGNPTLGLDINGLTAVTSANANDELFIYDNVNDANRKITFTSFVNSVNAALDNTRINDSADTTYVDTDENSGKVDVVADGGQVARFTGGSNAVTSAQFFLFNTGTSAGTIRVEASGTATDIDIRLVPKGNGQVFVGDTGSGIIQADDTFNLAIHGGNDGGDVIIRGGSSAGVVRIQDATSAEFVAFNDNHSITHYASGDTDARKIDYVLVGTTTNNTPTSIGTIAVPSDTTMLFEGYIVARDQTETGTTKSAGYKVTGVVANVGGTATLIDTNIAEVLAEGSNAINYAADIVASGGNIEVQVTGGASDNVKWVAFVKVIAVTY